MYHIGVHNIVDMDWLLRLWRPTPHPCNLGSLGSAVKASNRCRGLLLEAMLVIMLEVVVVITIRQKTLLSLMRYPMGVASSLRGHW